MRFRIGRAYAAFVVLFLAAAVLLRISDPFLISSLRLIAFDTYQRLFPESFNPDLPVRIVDVDEESLDRLGQWPWSRTVIADLVTKLADEGAAAIAFDVFFTEPDRTSLEEVMRRLPGDRGAALADVLNGALTNDQALAKAIAGRPVVLATALTDARRDPPVQKARFAFAGDDPTPFIRNFAGAARNLPILDEAAAGVGAVNWIPDRDQVTRRVQLVFRVGTTIVPSLAAEALRVASGASTNILKASNASGETAFGAETGLNHIKIGDLVAPTEADGAISIKYRPHEPAAFIPVWRVLSGDVPPDAIDGRIVLIGSSAAGLQDLRATPLDASIPGVEIQAQILEHLMKGLSITRPDYALGVELAVVVALGLLLALAIPSVSAFGSALLGLNVIGLVVIGAGAAYRYLGLLLDPLYPSAALFALVTAATLYVYRHSEAQRAEIRGAFGQYVSPAIVDELIANPDKLKLGGEVRDLTVLFCDVRSFTSISEGMTPHELTAFINELLTPLSGVILERRGTIDKYIGDAVMAFWNAPLDDDEHATHACEAALAMLGSMKDLNRRWKERAAASGRQFPDVAIGIGANTGPCCVGNLGSEQRFDYSCIGDDVNVASRLEGLTKQLGLSLVVSQETVSRARALRVPAIPVDRIRVKGRKKPTDLYTLLPPGDPALDLSRLAAAQQDFLAAYRGQEWQRALSLLATCRSIAGESLARYHERFAERIEAYRIDPPPLDWDGAMTAHEK